MAPSIVYDLRLIYSKRCQERDSGDGYHQNKCRVVLYDNIKYFFFVPIPPIVPIHPKLHHKVLSSLLKCYDTASTNELDQEKYLFSFVTR